MSDVPQISALLRYLDAKCIFQSECGSNGVRCGANPANPLCKIYSIEGASSLQHFLKSSKKQALRPRVRHNIVIYVCFYFHKPADSSNRVDDDFLRFYHLIRIFQSISKVCGLAALCYIVADKGLHFVREAKHGTANTGTVIANRPVHAVVPFSNRAVDPCDRSSASKLEHAGFISQL